MWICTTFNSLGKDACESKYILENILITTSAETLKIKEFDKDIFKTQIKEIQVHELLRKCVEENANSALEQTAYQEKYTGLVERYESAQKRIAEINDKCLERKAKREKNGVYKDFK